MLMRYLPVSKYARTAAYTMRNLASGDIRYPFYASYKITRRCNFTCSYCEIWREPKPELSPEDALRVIENIGRSSTAMLALEGGDPLLRDDIEEVLRFAHKQPFYILFVTSERNLLERPMERLTRYIDFLHISIDEGHRNLEMFDELEEYVRWHSTVCVQIVVRARDLPELPWKIERCARAGAKALIMPAVHLDRTKNQYPEIEAFRRDCRALDNRFPDTVITPEPYLEQIAKPHGCSASSIIIDSDGALFYPCRILGTKPVNLVEQDLMAYIESPEALEFRKVMKVCERRCGWYQYFATTAFVSPSTFMGAIRPYLKDLVR
jgi:MoaA/NifB/PqqE/SkfB family radical SAM enzyme